MRHVQEKCEINAKFKRKIEGKDNVKPVWFQLLTAASMKMRAFWNIGPYSLAGVGQSFRRAYCLHHKSDNGGSTNLWNVSLLQQGSHLLTHRRENLKTRMRRFTFWLRLTTLTSLKSTQGHVTNFNAWRGKLCSRVYRPIDGGICKKTIILISQKLRNVPQEFSLELSIR
jgi:hypothetical protein